MHSCPLAYIFTCTYVYVCVCVNAFFGHICLKDIETFKKLCQYTVCACTCSLFIGRKIPDFPQSNFKFQTETKGNPRPPWEQRVEVSTIYNYYTEQGNPAQNAINLYAIIDALLGKLLGGGGR